MTRLASDRHPDPAGRVAHLLAAELSEPAPSDVAALAARIVGGARPLGVLFYGSSLRGQSGPAPSAGGVRAEGPETASVAGVDPAGHAGPAADSVDMLAEGVLDFYVIVEHQRDWPRARLARIANALLPPNVEYHEAKINGRMLRAKVAILSIEQFRQRTRPGSLDTTVWARFSQPVRLVWVRDEAAADQILRCVIRAVATAATWAAELGPADGRIATYWEELFRHTYAAELRVESSNRPAMLLAGAEQRYDALLPACWQAGGFAIKRLADGSISPGLASAAHEDAESRWWLRAQLGRPLNIARLIKAAFTFTGGPRYLAWKIERHSGVAIPLEPVAGGAALWRLWRSGVFSRRKIGSRR